MTLFKAGQSRLVHEISILAVMAVLVGAYFIFRPGQPAAKTTPQTAPINTTFDTSTLDQVEKKDNNYPSIAPSNGGRVDPYAP
jgi:hypothetical protein